MVIGGRRSDREKKKESESGVTCAVPLSGLFARGYGRLCGLDADKGRDDDWRAALEERVNGKLE